MRSVCEDREAIRTANVISRDAANYAEGIAVREESTRKEEHT